MKRFYLIFIPLLLAIVVIFLMKSSNVNLRGIPYLYLWPEIATITTASKVKDFSSLKLRLPTNVNEVNLNDTTTRVFVDTDGVNTVFNLDLIRHKYTNDMFLLNEVYETGFRKPNSQICHDDDKILRYIIIVTSAPGGKHFRSAIRSTWGKIATGYDVPVVFFMGLPNNTNTYKLIEREYEVYKDLVVGNFFDIHEGSTVKSVSMLEWIYRYCNRSEFVLKCHEDTFVNVEKLQNYLGKVSERDRAMYGQLALKWKPVRNVHSKYYIPRSQYHRRTYPHFIRGSAYLFPGNLAEEMHKTSLKQPFLRLEDVFITGLIAKELRIQRIWQKMFLVSVDDPSTIENGILVHIPYSLKEDNLWLAFVRARKGW